MLVDDESLLCGPDAEQFDCATCEVATRLETLDEANREAWQLFRRVVSRLTMEGGLIGPMVQWVTEERPTDERIELVERLAVLYDVLVPVSMDR